MLFDWGQQQPASALLDARPLGLSGQELKSFAWKLCYAIHDLHSELKCGGTHGALELANILVRYDASMVASLMIVNHHGSCPKHSGFSDTETPGASVQGSTLATTSTNPHAPVASPKNLSDACPCEELHGNFARLTTVTSGDGDGNVHDGFMRAEGRRCVSNSACDTSGSGSVASCSAATRSTNVDSRTSGSSGGCAIRSCLRVATGGCSPVCDNVEMTNGWCRAPEQLLQLPYDRPADMFALGCILAEVATGQPLFPSTSAAEQLRRMRRLLQPVGPCRADSGGGISGCSTLSYDDYGTGSSDSNEKEQPLRPWLFRGIARETQTAAGSGGGDLSGALRTFAHSNTGVPSLAIADAAEEVQRDRERFVDLVEACLQINPGSRPTAEQVLKMTYFSSYSAVQLRSAPKPVALDDGNASAATASITAYVADIPDIIGSQDSGGFSPCTAVQAVPKHGASVPVVQLPVAEPPAVTPPESWHRSLSEFPLPSHMYDMVLNQRMTSSLEHCMKSSHPLCLRRVASAATSMAAPQHGAPSPSTAHLNDLWPKFLVTTQTTFNSPHRGCAPFPCLSTGGECAAAAAALAPTLSLTEPRVSAVMEQPIPSLPMQYSQNPGQIGQPPLQALQKQEEAQVLDCPFHTPGSTTDLMQREVPAPATVAGVAAAKRWLGPTNLRPRAPRYGRKEPQGFESALDLSLMLLKGSANVAARYGRQPPPPQPPRPTSRRQDTERCSSQLSSRNNWVVGPGTGAGVHPSTQAEETGPDAAARADTDAETTGADADASGHPMVPLGVLCGEKATPAVLGTSVGSGATGGGLTQAIAGASGNRQPYSRSVGGGSSLVSRSLIKRPSPLTLTADIEPVSVAAAAAAGTAAAAAAAAAGSAYTSAPGGLFALGGLDYSPSTEGPLQLPNPPPQVSRPGGERLGSHSSDVTVPHLDLTCILQGARRQGVEIAADCTAVVCSVSALQEGSCSHADCSVNSGRSGRSTADQSGVLLMVAASPSQPQPTQRHPCNLQSETDPPVAAMTAYPWATALADPGAVPSTDCPTAPLYGAIGVGRLIDGASKRRTRRSCSESQLSVHPSDPRFSCVSPASHAAATAAADTAATATCVGWSGCPVKGAASSSPSSGCGGVHVSGGFVVGDPAAQKLATETRLLWPRDLGPLPNRNMHPRMPKLSVDGGGGGGGGGGGSDGGRWPLPRLLNVLQRELIAQQHQYSTTTIFGSSSSTVGGGFAARSLPLYESDHLHTLSEASESSSSEIRLPIIHSIILPPNAGGEEQAATKADPSKKLLQPPPSPAETRRVTTGRLDTHSGMMLKTRLFDMGGGVAATTAATATTSLTAYGLLPSQAAAAPSEAATSKGLVQRARERFRIVFSEDGSGRAARDGGRSGGDGSIGGGDGSIGGGDGSRRGGDGCRGGGDGGRNGGDGSRRGGNGSRGGGDESRGGIDGGRNGGDGDRVNAEAYEVRPPRGSHSGADSSAMTGGSSGGKMALMSTLSRALRLGASIRQRVMPEKKEAR